MLRMYNGRALYHLWKDGFMCDVVQCDVYLYSVFAMSQAAYNGTGRKESI